MLETRVLPEYIRDAAYGSYEAVTLGTVGNWSTVRLSRDSAKKIIGKYSLRFAVVHNPTNIVAFVRRTLYEAQRALDSAVTQFGRDFECHLVICDIGVYWVIGREDLGYKL